MGKHHSQVCSTCALLLQPDVTHLVPASSEPYAKGGNLRHSAGPSDLVPCSIRHRDNQHHKSLACKKAEALTKQL